jgi:hypothetical protein
LASTQSFSPVVVFSAAVPPGESSIEWVLPLLDFKAVRPWALCAMCSAERGSVPEEVVANLSSSRTGLCEVSPAGAPPAESVCAGTCQGPAHALPRGGEYGPYETVIFNMLHTLRVMLLSALSATSATAAGADAPVSPVPIITVGAGTVIHVDTNGSRVLADCQEVTEFRMLAGPERGQFQRESKPCHLGSLVVHPPTGRWAQEVVVGGKLGPSRTVSVRVSGREAALPTDKAGHVKGGDLLILGDGNGIVAITSGTPEMWTTNGIYREQSPVAFTPDGSRVLVTAGDSGLREFWSWSFAPRPEGVRVLPAGMSDSEGNHVISGESRIVLSHPRGGVRLATQDPTGQRPWKVGAPLRQARRGLLTPLVLGDTMLFYREGVWPPDGAGCDESNPGTYRRLELSTGQERVWRRHEGECSTRDFAAASVLRRTVYFLEGHIYRGFRLFEYDIARDATREIEIKEVTQVLDISADGRMLLMLTYSGLVLHDVVEGNSTSLTGVASATHARLLALP